jgi:hypothetical protein
MPCARGARPFYQDVFGLPVEAEDQNFASFRFQNMSVTLLDIPGARELIGPALVADGLAGSRFHITNFMDPDLCDADAAAAVLAGHPTQIGSACRRRNGPKAFTAAGSAASALRSGGHQGEAVALAGARN